MIVNDETRGLAAAYVAADAAQRDITVPDSVVERARSEALVALVMSQKCNHCNAAPGQECTGRPRVLDVLWGCPGMLLRAHLCRMMTSRQIVQEVTSR